MPTTLATMSTRPNFEDFPFVAQDKLRYGDTDRQGHINNAVYMSFLETGRTEFMHDPRIAVSGAEVSFVLAHVSLDYLNEILWPGHVDIGTRVLSVGGSSIRVQQCIFQDGELKASGEAVIVQVSNETRKPHRLSAEARERLKQFISAPS